MKLSDTMREATLGSRFTFPGTSLTLRRLRRYWNVVSIVLKV